MGTQGTDSLTDFESEMEEALNGHLQSVEEEPKEEPKAPEEVK